MASANYRFVRNVRLAKRGRDQLKPPLPLFITLRRETEHSPNFFTLLPFTTLNTTTFTHDGDTMTEAIASVSSDVTLSWFLTLQSDVTYVTSNFLL